MARTYRIGTRGSALALVQANKVAGLLQEINIPTEIVTIKTQGDMILDKPLAKIGGKGLFLKEIEDALLKGDVDLAVHSYKDVPAEVTEGTVIAAVLEREDARDVAVVKGGQPIEKLKKNVVIGTSSIRRVAQLQKQFPEAQFVSLRGNVGTRLSKVESGEVDVAILAAAGLNRLGLENKITQFVETIPAVAQGVIALQARDDDEEVIAALKKLNHEATEFCVEIERKFLTLCEGNCQTPLGCHVYAGKKGYNADLFLASVDGSSFQEAHFTEEEADVIEQKVLDATLDFFSPGILTPEKP